MKKILFWIFVVLFSVPSWALEVSGTVVDQDGEPLIGAAVTVPGTTLGVVSLLDGTFNENFSIDPDTSMEISYVGCEDLIVNASELNGVTLALECSKNYIESVKVGSDFKSRDCNQNELDQANAVAGRTVLAADANGVQCNPTECKKGFKLADGRCVSRNGDECPRDLLNKYNAKSGKYFYDGSVESCTDIECKAKDKFYGEQGKCLSACDITATDRGNGITEKTMINERCYPSACNMPRWKLVGTGTGAKCEDQVGKSCAMDSGSDALWERVAKTEYVYEGNRLKCVVTACRSKAFKINAARNDCEQVKGDCDSGDKNALSAQWDNGICRIKSCNIGFRVDKQNNVCVTRNGDDCTSSELKKYPGAVSGSYLYENGMETCVDLKCSDAYKTNADATKCIKKQTECTSEQKAQHPFATEWGIEPGTENCVALDCKCGYKLDEIAGKCIEKSESERMCNKQVKPYLPANATKATMQCVGGKEVCIIPDDGCVEDYDLDKPNNRCIKKVGTECTISGDNNHVKRAVYQKVNGNLKCVIKKCVPDWAPNDDGTECKQVSGECTVTDDEHVSNDKRGTLKKGKCIPNACKPGYKVIDGVCVVSQCKCGEREEGNKCVKREGDSLKCTPLTTSPKVPANAEYGKITCPNGANGKEVCQIDENSCKAGFKADVPNNRCISEQGLPCNDDARKLDVNATLGEFDVLADGSKQCKIVKCIENWAPNGDGTKCVRVSGPCPDDDLNAIEYATAGEWRDSKCFATECQDGYKPNKSGKCIANLCGCKQKLVNNKCIDKTENELACTYTSVPKLHSNAATGVIACNAKGKEYCKVLTCKDNYEKNDEETKCISTKNDKCEFTGDTKTFVKTARYRERNKDMVCVITACTDGYMVDEKSNTCIVSEGPCSDKQYKAIDKATAGQLKKGKCYPTQCESGYEPNGDKCVQIGGACTPDEDINATVGVRKFNPKTNTEWCKITGCVGGYDPNEDGTACVVNAEEQKKIEEAQKKYDAAKENEQSLANRMLGGASMGAMGVGGMMMVAALSEQKADADAERDMAAYLATFKCDYGMGKNIKGGEKDVELPGASELIPLYAEYVTLANDLKLRKSKLGLKAGIESEKILDSATTGLYDDVSTGISSGVYASLARALQNPDGEDAKKWAEQKDKTAQKLKTGAITAGVGAVIGIAGNAINNGIIKNKEKAKPAAAIKLEQDLANEKPAPVACPSQASGVYPNCVCNSNKEYDRNSNVCRECTGGRKAKVIAGVQQCVCADNETFDNKIEKCVKAESGPTCDADAGEQLQDGQCVKVTSSEEVLESLTAETFTVNLPSDILFEVGKSTLRAEVQKHLDTFATNLKITGMTDCTDVMVDGYTDTTGSQARNKSLSNQRSQAVLSYLLGLDDFKAVLATGYQSAVVGYGEGHCTCGAGGIPSGKENDSDYKYCVGKASEHVVPDSTPYAPCRRVQIKMTCQWESTLNSGMDSVTTLQSSTGVLTGLSAAVVAK